MVGCRETRLRFDLDTDAAQDERFQTVKSVSLYGIRSLMCVPLRLRERIVGTVYLDSRQNARMFNAEDLRFLEAFAHLAANALPKLDAQGLIVRGRGRHFSSGANTDELRARLAGDAPALNERVLTGDVILVR